MRGRAAAAAAAGLLLASPARADNCAGFGDCGGVLAATLAAAGLAVLIAFVVQLLPLLVSLAVDVSPLGRARGIAEAITGVDMLTGQRLSFLERALGVLPGGRTARAVQARRLLRNADQFKPAVNTGQALRQRLSFTRSALATLENGGGKIIAGQGAIKPTVFRGAAGYAVKYGGLAQDYVKVTVSSLTRSGERVSVHAVKNVVTGKIYDPKVLIGR